MKGFFLYIILSICVSVTVIAQVNISGIIIDKSTNEPLIGASIIIKDANGKIQKFSSTKSNGEFALQLSSINGYHLEVSMMSFAKQSIPMDSVIFPLTIYLEPGGIQLKEVAVKAHAIREQGDTITYNVGSFAQKQDRSIGDVLKRMPGINVEKSGKIQYQGEDINKFYIEGSDLLGGKYGIATNGISHEDVGAVEVMENHQPMQVLSGISFSEKAAINLKLKNKAKATWTFHGDAGSGYAWQPDGMIWDAEMFTMAVMPNFQNITTLKTNNTGKDLSAQTTDFFASRRGTELSPYIDISLPGVPNLNEKRTLFNRSAIISTNNLWKLRHGEFKAQLDYSFNRVSAEAANTTTYFLNSGDRIITENRMGIDRSHSLSGKFIYEMNQKTAFINNTLKTDIDWDDISLQVTGSLPNYQNASLPDYYVCNDFKLIKRFNKTSQNISGSSSKSHLITFTSKNEWESMPQTLSMTMDNDFSRQDIKDHSFYTHENIAYVFSLKGITVSLDGGIKGYARSLNTELTSVPGSIPTEISLLGEETTNVLNTNYFTFYVTPRFEYWVKRVNFSVNAPVSFTHYSFDKALANRNETYFSPSLYINWKPNNRTSIGLRGSTGRSPMNLHTIQPGIIMTNYRSFRRGTDNFYNSTSQSVSVNISYKHTRHGLFANGFVIQSWSHNPYTLAQQLYGDYIVYSYSRVQNTGKMFMVNGDIGKTLDFMRGSANLNGSFSKNESHLIAQYKNDKSMTENQSVNSIGTSWSIGAKINGAPLRWINLDYQVNFSSSRLTMNQAKASWLTNLENKFLLNIILNKKLEWHINGEHYRNELTTDNFKNVFLLDTKVIFNINKRFELSATLNNIFNQRTYNYKIYNQLNSFESQRWLRGRELLISISLRK